MEGLRSENPFNKETEFAQKRKEQINGCVSQKETPGAHDPPPGLTQVHVIVQVALVLLAVLTVRLHHNDHSDDQYQVSVFGEGLCF